ALQQQLAPQQILIEKMQKDFSSQDSIRRELAARENNFEFKLEREIKSVPRPKRYDEETKNSFYYNNDDGATPMININKAADCPDVKTPLTSKSKNFKISIKRMPGTANVSVDKKVIQFYFNDDAKKSTNSRNISVEVTN
ncbi:MAG: hypothetical protein ABI358_00495, partial [Ginsengibacter sp.]